MSFLIENKVNEGFGRVFDGMELEKKYRNETQETTSRGSKGCE